MLSSEQLLTAIRDTVRHPATAKELAQALRIPREERATFKRQLKTLVADGQLIQTRGNHFGLPDKMDLVVGTLHAHPGGYGFVAPEAPEGASPSPRRRHSTAREDIYVAAHNLTDAMHGDRVVVRMERKSDRGIEGRIMRVLDRAQARLVGRFETDSGGLGYVVPFDKRVTVDVHVPSGHWAAADPGDMVVVEITRWPTPTRGPIGSVREVLGRVDEAGVDTEVIIRKYGISDAHGPEAVAEALRHGAAVKPRDIAGRTDFRGVTTVTIDGEHARDFDDAITIERLPDGHYWLGVHIADVSHYVKEGSALDEEAYERGTSVYFPERAVHMFPSELSTGLCSLNPRVDRLVQSCLMEVDQRGQVVRYEMHDGVINSDARMTYTAVNAILTEHDPEVTAQHRPLVPMFELMRELFGILNERRRRRGAIDFDLPEAEVLLTEFGEIEGIVATERNIAHRIIEEFMLLANETVAGHLERHQVPALHRVHEAPDVKKVEDFEVFISSLGYSLAASGTAIRPRHFQKLIDRIKGTPEERPIAALMLRTMQKARYDAVSLGHFGLAAEHYTHFTSPIRRYPDLVVHRMLRESRYGEMAVDRREELEEDLPEIARHTSAMERRADDAERELLQWKKVRFMENKVGDEYDGYIVGVAQFGLFVELTEHYVEGLVHISSMADDYYRFVEQQHVLRGENTKKTYRLGDHVRVQVVRVDMERRQIDLGLTEVLDAVRHEKRPRGPIRSTVRSKKEQRLARRPGRRERLAAGAAKGGTGKRRSGKRRR